MGVSASGTQSAKKHKKSSAPLSRSGFLHSYKQKHFKNQPDGIFACLAVYAGLSMMKKARRLKRRSIRLMAFCKLFANKCKIAVVRNLKIFAARNAIDLTAWQTSWEALRSEAAKALGNGLWGLLKFLFAGTFRGLASLMRHMVRGNYVAPLLAAACFAFIVYTTLNLTFALEVNYNGKSIGYIAEESVFDEAEKEMLSRIVFEDYIRPDDTIPSFSIKPVFQKQLSTEHEITNEIIKASGNELSEATGLYIDNRFMGAVNDGRALSRILNEVKNSYRTDDENEEVEFVKEVRQVQGLYPVTSIVDLGLLEGELNSEQSEQRIYRAVAGDAPVTIAKKNGIPYSQLKSLNPDIEKSLVIGQEVLVEKAVPMLEVKVVRTEVSQEDIAFKIEHIQDSSKYEGYVSVAQRGVKGTREVTAKVTYVGGIETAREVLTTRVVKEPIKEKVIVGGMRPLQQLPQTAQSTSSYFRWPVDGGRITCLFGNAGYYGHTGLDIGGLAQGAAIRASAAGTVVKVRYDTWNYGYHIVIDHGGGVQTLYAHNSKIYVKAGEWVEQGQLIAGMGRTGRATGVHVHFEVRVNGVYMNPTKYIGTTPY